MCLLIGPSRAGRRRKCHRTAAADGLHSCLPDPGWPTGTGTVWSTWRSSGECWGHFQAWRFHCSLLAVDLKMKIELQTRHVFTKKTKNDQLLLVWGINKDWLPHICLLSIHLKKKEKWSRNVVTNEKKVGVHKKFHVPTTDLERLWRSLYNCVL